MEWKDTNMSLQENTTTVTLNNGTKIPVIGLGTWRTVAPDSAEEVVKSAIQNGYRHIDTAAAYGNEAEVGAGIKASGVPREELFITTKLRNVDHDIVQEAIDSSLKNLGLDYVDLYLIHWPLNGTFEDPNAVVSDCHKVWLEMQKVYESGKAKAIGVSNFSKSKIESLLSRPGVTVTPAVNQIEAHPLLPQPELYQYLKEKNIYIESYSPLGSEGCPLFKDEVVQEMAAKYNVEPAQILISWGVQRGTIVLAKSVKTSRLISNKKTLVLEAEDFDRLNGLADIRGITRVGDHDNPGLFD